MGVGTKVTSDPESRRGVDEGVGVVTSDSLAAESYNDDDGSFGEGNRKAGVSEQPSRSTNTNNDDTSGATELGSADNARDRRERYGGDDEENDYTTGSGKSTNSRLKNNDLSRSDDSYSRSNDYSSRSNDTDDTYTGRTSDTSTGRSRGEDNDYSGSSGDNYTQRSDNSSSHDGGLTGGYAGAHERAQGSGVYKPKGSNITEDNDLEGETKFGAIGTDDDPSRLAEQKYLQDDSQGGSGMGNAGSDNAYGALRDE